MNNIVRGVRRMRGESSSQPANAIDHVPVSNGAVILGTE
ncbi:MAG: hypothetical protein ACJAUG_003522 [Halioglobus sp.]|jgi:hypothetical protein